MLRRCCTLQRQALSSAPVAPKLTRYAKGRKHINPWNREYWRTLQDPDRQRGSFWVSDFKHKYLMRTGGDYQGAVPISPAPGTYQNLTHEHAALMLGHPKPQRESRHLPIMPLTARVVWERRTEKWSDFSRKVRRDRRIILEVRDVEFHEWYAKLQRVRGRWCRDQGIASRGVYSAAVDAAEIWG
jgi:hypothetical protein